MDAGTGGHFDAMHHAPPWSREQVSGPPPAVFRQLDAFDASLAPEGLPLGPA